MILPENQRFTSPEEALAHFGMKGMKWGIRNDRTPGEFSNWGKPFSQSDGLSHGNKAYELKKSKKLRVVQSNNIADVRPAKGFASPRGKAIHDDMYKNLETLSKEYPNVAAMKIVMVPMSSVKHGPSGTAQAAVLHSKKGQLTVMYNDKAKEISPRQQKKWDKWAPGIKHEGYVANHEMGHVIAAAGKLTPDAWELSKTKTLGQSLDVAFKLENATETNHKAAFKKHGISFGEVSKMTPYAATSASEAYAELAGHYYTPQTNRSMSPEMKKKAKALFDDAGGKL
jgi:hypothetical protein